ncbi:EXS family-domain-containing protein [Ilyonectria robusta]|uniref:EXS family-domain-containing protein n=1 Tax=Ilyonectria robusta TaxID=1079257 RepID=UPI001E8E0073|nr:EXS family-domain-containing protein [Ilyonectria robusta]KAH8733697.1 EXS family-domain-containing protein [Ilyonectria robusta]
MKFAKDLEREAVPEWRIKYLNYKAGKKYVKAVSRAIARANASPNIAGQLRAATFLPPVTPRQTFRKSRDSGRNTADGSEGNGSSTIPTTASSAATVKPVPSPSPRRNESDALTGSGDNRHYGSFVRTPEEGVSISTTSSHNDFQLPAPAIKVQSNSADAPDHDGTIRRDFQPFKHQRSSTLNVAPPGLSPASPAMASISRRPTDLGSPSHLRRLFTHTSTGRSDRRVDINMQNLDLVREREQDFFEFLDTELEKVEAFYKMKEEQAGQRLDILRVQLHEMRNRRIQEMAQARFQDERAFQNHNGTGENGNDKINGWVNPIKSKIFPLGANSKALQRMGPSPNTNGGTNGGPQGDAARDYIRRPEDDEVSYRTAKRKLKLALQEFYRGLELLKSYAMLNRTAFRKLNKKYDKAINARPPYRYMNEKVNRAWFVNSDVLEGHIQVVEDLYSRYFERGNHKLAAGKLRQLTKKPEDQSTSMFQNGLLIGTGAVFAIQGLIYGSQLLFDDDPRVRVRTSYLLQIYGGYFLMLYLFALFCINCAIWNNNKVNYPFIFEFDQRHSLDWRELARFPSFFFLVLGLFMWVNFSGYGAEGMYIYYPVILIFVTTILIFFPAPILWHRSRKWFAYSHWRLLLAGLYPVEFRDFFLGDIYCSLTYATANMELFFCLYANSWENPVQCNSSHSRLLGFFTAMPAVWRLLQCLRRYKDTSNIFPHLVNGGKYTATILAAVMLSFYRFNNTHTNLGLFIAISSINSIYCSIWDLFMDFSLLQPQARHWCLRDILALKSRWLYYFIMVVDPILRFAWIFYAIFTHNTQHSTIVSFMVAFMEVTRRGMWTLFRVENEHCANVAQYKASRDVPLPYRIEPLTDRASLDTVPASRQGTATSSGLGRQSTAASTGVAGSIAEDGTMRRRPYGLAPKRNFSRILAEAHKQDFEKRRRPAEQAEEEEAAQGGQSDDDDDDDDADESESLLAREADDLVRDAR